MIEMKAIKTQVSKLWDAFERLNPRERLFVGVGIIAMAFFVVSLAAIGVKSALNKKKAQIEALRGGVIEISALEDAYKAALQRKEAFLKQLEANKGKLRGRIGTIASARNINIDSVVDVQGTLGAKSAFQEEIIKVSIRKIGFPQLFDFFQNIEQVSDFLYLKNAQITRRYDNIDLVDVSFNVATIKPK